MEPHQVEVGTSQMDLRTETEYYIKVSDGNEWFVNRDKSYDLNDALKKRDEMLDGISGRRC
ncbi:hypothetical protein LCGC14_1081600 [marine sediment metagenome]|uniref:Uncharacterized protein n=1 Tax=marine sediment metagenome TaxID=412755 RepID=A0A0F9MJT9_9ZZZZ